MSKGFTFKCGVCNHTNLVQAEMESMPNGHVVICGHCHTRYKIKHNFDKNKMLGGALAGGLAGAALGGFPGAIIGTSAGALFGSLGTSAMPFDKKEGEGNV